MNVCQSCKDDLWHPAVVFKGLNTEAHGKTSAELRRSLSIPKKSGLQGHKGLSLEETDGAPDRTNTEGKREKPHQEEGKTTLCLKTVLWREEAEKRGVENAATAFCVKTKTHKEKWETPPQRSWLVGQDLNFQNTNTSCKHMHTAEPGTLRTVILSNNVFSSLVASLVARLALWPETALKTTIMMVTSWCLGTASASPNGGWELNVTDRLSSPVLYRHTQSVQLKLCVERSIASSIT